MGGSLITPGAALRALGTTVGLLVVVLLIATIFQPSGLAVATVVLWLLIVGGLGLGAWLIARGERPLAGAGAIVMALAVWVAFFVPAQPVGWLIWTVLFFVGVGLIVRGTAQDTTTPHAWVLLIPRVGVGWAMVDNAQDHFWSAWLPGGGGFLQVARGAATREPLYFLDPLYQGFLKSVVVPGADTWAALTLCGELSFGLLLAIGFLTPIAACGLMWHHVNYVFMRGFTPHGAYTDKTFFLLELFCLITLPGLAYGLDAVLRKRVPAVVAETAMGLPAPAGEPVRVGRPEAQPT